MATENTTVARHGLLGGVCILAVCEGVRVCVCALDAIQTLTIATDAIKPDFQPTQRTQGFTQADTQANANASDAIAKTQS